MHIARAEQIARGGVLPQEVSIDDIDTSIVGVVDAYKGYSIYGGETDTAIYELLAKGALYRNSEHSGAIVFPGWNHPELSVTTRVGESTTTWAFPNASLNSPLAYLPHIIGYWLARLVTDSPWATIALMRVFGVVAYGAIAYTAIGKIPIAKWLLFAIAISPNAVLSNSLVSADTMTVSLSFLFIAMIVRFCMSDFVAQKSDWILLGLSLCSLGLLKLPYVCLGLLLPLIVVVNKKYRDKVSLARFAAIGMLTLALLFLWQSCTSGVQSYVIWGDTGTDSTAQIRSMLAHPFSAAKAICGTFMTGSFGLLADPKNPKLPVWPVIALFFCAFLCESRRRPVVECRNVIAYAFFAVSMLGSLVVCAALYLTFTEVGGSAVKGVQPRYYLPFLLLALIALYMLSLYGCPEEGTKGSRLPVGFGSTFTMTVERNKSVCAPMVVFTILMALFYIYYFIDLVPHFP